MLTVTLTGGGVGKALEEVGGIGVRITVTTLYTVEDFHLRERAHARRTKKGDPPVKVGLP
jgi:hypothetical protein